MNEYVANVSIRIDADSYDDFIEALHSGDWDNMEVLSVTEPEPTGPTPEQIENKYWKNAVGTTSLSERGYRSFWD